MWANLLSKSHSQLDESDFIEFGELKAFDIDAGVFDESWLPQEEAKSANDVEPVLDDPQMKLFNE
jgi:hypothetical protein